MSKAEYPLDVLIAGLCGRLVAQPDWPAVIALANHALLTPALFVSLERAGLLPSLPNEVRDYLRFLHDRNRERNLRLRAQLVEAVATLNGVGITPVLLKGAIPLFLSRSVPSRMTSDLDLAVAARDEAPAQACLEELGYRPVAEGRGMARPQDVGVLELRAYRPDGLGRPKLVQQDELLVNIPPAPSRALHWMMHDLLKEGDYWRGRIDLRHMYDLAQLAESGRIDWSALRAMLPDRTALNAVDTQLLALHRFFATEIPAACAGRPLVRFQHWRRVFAARHAILGAPLRLAGNLAWGVRRFSRVRDLVRRDPVYLLRRTAIILFNRSLRSKV